MIRHTKIGIPMTKSRLGLTLSVSKPSDLSVAPVNPTMSESVTRRGSFLFLASSEVPESQASPMRSQEFPCALPASSDDYGFVQLGDDVSDGVSDSGNFLQAMLGDEVLKWLC